MIKGDAIMSEQSMKRTYWVAIGFYLIIVFEFFYMAGPFALYFYSAYKPGLNFFYNTPALAWLPRFFLPHLVMMTTCPLIDLHNMAGAVLTTLGLLGFIFGATQVYASKLAKKGAVTGGVYNFVRHPQYTSLIFCGLGLLLLWPRYIVLVLFITMLFAYYLLARIEEKECEQKFGRAYIDYKEKTGMFIPLLLSRKIRTPPFPSAKGARIVVCLLIYLTAQLGGIGVAKIIENHSKNSLYAHYSENAVHISLTDLDSAKVQNLVRAALNNPSVQSRLAQEEPGMRLLSYIVPWNVFISEIPMNVFEGPAREHFLRSGVETEVYKVIVNKAILSGHGKATNEQILGRVTHRIPLIEIWINSADSTIVQVLDPPEKKNYEGIPMPIF